MPKVEPQEHPPGIILAYFLRALGVGAVHTAPEWPVFEEYLPDYKTSPRRVISCSTTSPENKGTLMIEGRTVQHHGVQIRVRAEADTIAYRRIALIQQKLNQASVTSIVIDGVEYTIHRARIASGPLKIGRSDEGRFDYTLNILASITTVI